MRNFSHWTLRYILDRSRLWLFEKSSPGLPWLTRDAICVIDSLLRPSDVGLETGSGRSTVWLANRVDRLISVEHDPGWFASVSRSLEKSRLSVEYYLEEDGAHELADCNYVNRVKRIPSGSLDFALIDGVCRDHCALLAVDLIKPGGFLIVDNANWYLPRSQPSRSPNSRWEGSGYTSEVWCQFSESTSDWRRIWTTNGVTDTAIFLAPGLPL